MGLCTSRPYSGPAPHPHATRAASVPGPWTRPWISPALLIVGSPHRPAHTAGTQRTSFGARQTRDGSAPDVITARPGSLPRRRETRARGERFLVLPVGLPAHCAFVSWDVCLMCRLLGLPPEPGHRSPWVGARAASIDPLHRVLRNVCEPGSYPVLPRAPRGSTPYPAPGSHRPRSPTRLEELPAASLPSPCLVGAGGQLHT